MRKIIPPKLYLLCQCTSLLIHFSFFKESEFSFGWNLLGIFPLVGGLFLAAKAKQHFAQVDTEINTFESPQKLVQDHAFKYSRNPMYLGMLVSLVGTPILLSNPYLLIFPLVFYSVSSFCYIPFEEHEMNKEFPIGYAEYKQKVRKWI